jgi:hypothetical protein
MPVHLETTAHEEVAIIRGIHGDDALERLARDLAEGIALDGYAGLVVDLGSGIHSPQALDALDRASAQRLRRHQVVCTAESARVDETLDRVLRWHRMLSVSALPRLPVVHEMAVVLGTVVAFLAGPVRSALRLPRPSVDHSLR